MFYYVYILESQKDNSLYIGYTSDLKKRFEQHNDGESQATKPHRPYKLIFYEAFLDRIDAKNREVYLKGGYGRKTIKGLLKKYLKRNEKPSLNCHCERSEATPFELRKKVLR